MGPGRWMEEVLILSEVIIEMLRGGSHCYTTRVQLESEIEGGMVFDRGRERMRLSDVVMLPRVEFDGV